LEKGAIWLEFGEQHQHQSLIEYYITSYFQIAIDVKTIIMGQIFIQAKV
jgi:hypothetical protein